MKTTVLLAALAITFAAASGALADDKTKTKSGNEAKATTADKTQPSQLQLPKAASDPALTGSHIKRLVRRNGMITDGPNQVVVIDHKTIENSGASDLRQLLFRKGIR